MNKIVAKIPSAIPALFPNSTSLVARAGQIIAVFIALGMLSMISSMLVSESLSGDAAQINHAGALRMQAVRVSRAHLVDDTVDKALVKQEITLFEQRLDHLFSGGILPISEKPDIVEQYQKVRRLWQQLNDPRQQQTINSFEPFIRAIDHLVSLLQQESEKKLNLLRLIQGISLLALLLVSAFVLVKLNRMVIMPLNELVEVAKQIAKGNFEQKASYSQDNELGLLANTINQMSSELKTTYQDFEQRVQTKTEALTQSNQSLELLFRSARKLTSHQYHQISAEIITEIEQVLGFGRIEVELNDQREQQIILTSLPVEKTLDRICFNQHKFPLEKQSQLFGYLVWHFPKGRATFAWQKQMLQAMADMIATAIELEQKRNSENRLLIVEERAVIARELHDSLAQSLSYLKVQVSLLERKIQKNLDKAQIDSTIADLKQGLNKAYQQLRELLTTFRLKLDDPSIENAIRGTVTEFAAKCQHSIGLDYQLPQNYLSPNQEIHMLQIIREALSNVHRHAGASDAGITIQQHNGKVQVAIWDNGCGLPKQLAPHGHFGLGIMEERAKSLHCLIEITDRKPQGTLVSFQFSRTTDSH